MSLTPANLNSIELIVTQVVDRKLDEKLQPIKGELEALGSDIKAIYHMLKRKQDKSAAKRQYRRLEALVHKPA